MNIFNNENAASNQQSVQQPYLPFKKELQSKRIPMPPFTPSQLYSKQKVNASTDFIAIYYNVGVNIRQFNSQNMK